jgi:L,D-transpeptidase-like protein
MSRSFSRRDFLKFGGLSLAGLAFMRATPGSSGFDDSEVVRVATTSVSVYSSPSDKAGITGTWYKDDLVHIYEQVVADEPDYNRIWYRVWGGFMHRARLQRVKTILNIPLDSIPEGQRLLAEVTVPYVHPWRKTNAGWQDTLQFRLYFESVYWIEAIESNGPDGEPWYRIWDDLAGIYYAPARFMRPIPPEELAPISPEITDKRIDVNLTTQHLSAYENGKIVFQTSISSGIPFGKTATSTGKFNVDPKTPSKHMGNGNLFAGADDYELPGVPWTSFFTGDGQAFHGTYWHENFGSPMSHGCINMRTSEAKWIYRWTSPIVNVAGLLDATDARSREMHGLGTAVNVHY